MKAMNVTGAKICEELPHPETRDIVLPNQSDYVSHIAVDVCELLKVFSLKHHHLSSLYQIGGSLAKVVYFSRKPTSSIGGRLNFIKFETDKIDECIEFIENLVAARSDPNVVIKATGGGSYKYYDEFTKKIKGVKMEKEDEMECLIKAEIPYEVFTYSEHNPMHFEYTSSAPSNMFPYMLGGGTLWGLLSLLTGAQSFDEMLEMSKHGDNTNVDMLVGDIYGSDYSKIGLKSSMIASSMGKVFKKNVKQSVGNFRSEDISKSLLYMVSNNIGQIAYLNAQAHGLKQIYFGGCFIRGHPITMNTLSYAVNFWSKGTIKALFLRHEGYLGAVGAFLKHGARQRSGSFSEIFTNPQMITKNSINACGVLESTPINLTPFPKIDNLDSYNPDTLKLTDPSPWIDVLETNLHKLVELVVKSCNSDDNGDNSSCDVGQRATKFDSMFRKHLALLRDRPAMYGALTVRSLLNLREQCLHELGFSDIFVKVKAEENKTALESLQKLLVNIDSIQNVEDKIDLLIDNILAGNMFDWGSGQILDMLKKGELSFESAHTKIKKPEHLNQTNKFKQRVVSKTKPLLRKAVIFVDNSGADIVLGIIPFARFLISLDMDVILAANSFPAANDVTADELTGILSSVSEMDSFIAAAWVSKKLTVMATGSSSPCLDLIRINEDLAKACEDVDLVGMGRAIHTNYNAMFTCASLKLAVFKSSLAANDLGANIYDAIVLYDEGSAANA
ncbi:15054_t:CDS:2 [Cetraspora pellucida]|uniref:15054_t:CDS:1 n=1 Tax=Cetraspora pellucida TaxID=1433469 RepID=A0ACA9JW06_9GLOM|nr:15054_t:CDS:2 [Cetraspora pellucida]